MVASTKRSSRSRRIEARGESTSPIICGFTPRKISRAVRAISSLDDTVAPASASSAASISAFAGVRLDSRITSAILLFAAARATADPIVPTPMNPIV